MDDDLEGRRLGGRYRIDERIASGGMATVWRATDEVLGRPVAVKILHDRLSTEGDILDRFRREAVAAARLSHPAVVRVFDTGIDDGVCYIVMELSAGSTLADLLESRGPLPPGEAAAIIREVLHGLAHAHRAGVVHRDVKPGNILLDAGGLVKVTDFGIAKAAFAGGDLTTTGNLIGTARYLAPEQVSGDRIDHRTDLYAVGVVLYELLTGRPPFVADSHLATATMRLTKDPTPPGALRPGIPRDLEALVMRSLARDPDRRFQSAEEMSAALDRFAGRARPVPRRVSEHEPAPEPAGSFFRSWMLVPVILALIAALAVGGFVLFDGLEGGTAGGGGGRITEGGTRPLRMTEPLSYDPLGDGSEHDEELGGAVDRDPATYWTTEGYTTEDLGGAKPGVGIVFPLEERTDVGLLRIRTDTPGFAFSLYASDTPDAFDLGSPLPSAEGEEAFTADEEQTDIELQPVRTRYLMMWITRLVPTDGFRAHVNEAELFAP